jgi:DNA-binding response OmpR family regulator
MEAIPVFPKRRAMSEIGTILVLEPDGAIRSFIAEALEEAGYMVLQACDRVSMYLMLASHEPDLLLFAIDRAGARATGWLDTAHALAQPPLPIVVMTTETTGVALPESVGSLLKPFELTELFAIVAQHIQPRQCSV